MKPASLHFPPLFSNGAHGAAIPPVVRTNVEAETFSFLARDSSDGSSVPLRFIRRRSAIKGERLRARVRDPRVAGDADVGQQGVGDAGKGAGGLCERQIPRPLTRQGRRLHKQPRSPRMHVYYTCFIMYACAVTKITDVSRARARAFLWPV